MFTRIRLISIPVINQQVAKEFYTDVLGCRVEMDMPFGTDDKTRWISLQLPGVDTRISLATWFPQMPPGSAQGIVLATENISAAHSELKQRGLMISDIKNQPYGREATSSDPDGNGWVLQQPAQKIST
jgi:catechol 2,3-dioxygenase-like lactoylglutathione lyase family enzyme